MTPPLLSIFRDRLIPWAQDNLNERLIIASPAMRQSQMPSGVKLTRKKIPGKRIIVRNQRDYGNQRIVCARWPEAGMHELAIPKLVCVIEGVTDFQAGEYVIRCSEGHFIFLPPYTSIVSERQPNLVGASLLDGYCSLLQFPVYRDGIQCFLATSRGPQYFLDPNFNFLVRQPQAVEVFKLFVEEILKESGTCPELGEHLLAALFLYFANELKTGNPIHLLHHSTDRAYLATEHIPSKSSATEIRHYIQTHLQERPTIQKVAREMHMSPRQFTRHLRNTTGQSFVEILTQCRLEEAKRLLGRTEWSISTIAGIVGFESPTYFNVFFKRYENCSPGTYRKNYNHSQKLAQ